VKETLLDFKEGWSKVIANLKEPNAFDMLLPSAPSEETTFTLATFGFAVVTLMAIVIILFLFHIKSTNKRIKELEKNIFAQHRKYQQDMKGN